MTDKKRNGTFQSLDAFDIWYAEGAEHHLFLGIVKVEDGSIAFAFAAKPGIEEARKCFEEEGSRVLHITSFVDVLSEMVTLPMNGQGKSPYYQ